MHEVKYLLTASLPPLWLGYENHLPLTIVHSLTILPLELNFYLAMYIYSTTLNDDVTNMYVSEN